jgi:hypothetical protein
MWARRHPECVEDLSMPKKDATPTREGRVVQGRVAKREPVAAAIRKARDLTPEEEKVVRVRHGAGGDPDLALSRKGEGFEETLAFLEMMELRALVQSGRLDLAKVRPDVKRKIVASLRDKS